MVESCIRNTAPLAVGRAQRIDQVEQLVRRDGCGTGRGYARRRAVGSVQHTVGLARAVAADERGFLRVAHPARKLGGDVTGDVEHRVLQQFVDTLIMDAILCAPMVIWPKASSDSGIVPSSSTQLAGAMRGHQRDLAIA